MVRSRCAGRELTLVHPPTTLCRRRNGAYSRGDKAGHALIGLPLEYQCPSTVAFERSLVAKISSTYTIAIPDEAFPRAAAQGRSSRLVGECTTLNMFVHMLIGWRHPSSRIARNPGLSNLRKKKLGAA